MLPPDEQHLLLSLLRTHRWAALATQGKDGPEASWVAYAPADDFSALWLHLSRLASHTRNLLDDPRAALAVSEAERPDHDPQQLARVTLFGRVEVVERDSTDYATAARLYLHRLPDAEQLFSFADFRLFRFIPERARLVGGFARAYTLDAAGLRAAAG